MSYPQPFFAGLLQGTLLQPYNCSSPASCLRWSIAESADEGRAGKNCPHNLPLHADPPAMNDAQGFQPEAIGFLKVGFYNIRNLFGLHGMQVENVGNGNPDRFVFHGQMIINDNFTECSVGRAFNRKFARISHDA